MAGLARFRYLAAVAPPKPPPTTTTLPACWPPSANGDTPPTSGRSETAPRPLSSCRRLTPERWESCVMAPLLLLSGGGCQCCLAGGINGGKVVGQGGELGVTEPLGDAIHDGGGNLFVVLEGQQLGLEFACRLAGECRNAACQTPISPMAIGARAGHEGDLFRRIGGQGRRGKACKQQRAHHWYGRSA